MFAECTEGLPTPTRHIWRRSQVQNKTSSQAGFNRISSCLSPTRGRRHLLPRGFCEFLFLKHVGVPWQGDLSRITFVIIIHPSFFHLLVCFLVGFVFVFDVQSGFVAQSSFDLLADPSVFASQIPRALDAHHCTYWVCFLFKKNR